jgi:hypothetical protein
MLPFAAMRHEPVAEHQLRGDRAEQIVVDMEVDHVDEREPVALGQAPRLRNLRGDLRRIGLDVRRVHLGVGRHGRLLRRNR